MEEVINAIWNQELTNLAEELGKLAARQYNQLTENQQIIFHEAIEKGSTFLGALECAAKSTAD